MISLIIGIVLVVASIIMRAAESFISYEIKDAYKELYNTCMVLGGFFLFWTVLTILA